MADLRVSIIEHHRFLAIGAAFVLLLAAWLARLATAPIARLPGSFWSKFSVIPIVYHDLKSNRTNWTNELHARYGPVVRLSPHEVSIYSPTAIRDVFTGSAKTGYYGKAPLFNIFQHYGARNVFSSIQTEGHSWRRKIVAGNYAQTAIIAKEARHGLIWRGVGKFLGHVEREGISTSGSTNAASRSVDVFSASRFYSTDNISSHLFVEGSHALDGDIKARRFIESSAEQPEDVMTHLKMEFETAHAILQNLRNVVGHMLGVKSVSQVGRSRQAKASGKKVENPSNGWYGGNEVRDWGFSQFMASRKALEAGSITATLDDPVSARLATNAMSADALPAISDTFADDVGVRSVRSDADSQPTLMYRNEGCASECMDQLLAGMDTVGDTLSYALHLLSLPQNAQVQQDLQEECQSLGLPSNYDEPLSQERLNAVQASPILEAMLKETLRAYPASTTALQRVVPDGGRMLDGCYVPGGVIVGASPATTNNDVEVFDRTGKYDVSKWVPERWLDTDAETLAEMNRRLWTFGSGGRGCIGKHFAILEMKLLIAGIYTRYTTKTDDETPLPKPQSHPSQRTTFRDIDWFSEAKGVIAFVPCDS